MRPAPLRSTALAVGALALLVANGCGGGPERPRPAGILLVVLDCLRADHLGLHGFPHPVSPRIDELGRGGVVFERAWSQASWTRPSLPSLLTGLYPSEHGISDDFASGGGKKAVKKLSSEAETLAELLGARGYRTGLFGYQVQLSRNFALDQGFDVYQNRLGRAPNIRRRFRLWVEKDDPRPFFAYLHFLELHWPYCVKGAYGAVDPSPGSRNFCGNWREVGDQLADGRGELSPADLVALRARYAEQILELDYQIGLLMDELRAAGRWEETLVVLTSDHGEELFEHGGFRHGHQLHEELLHVPLIWKLPASWGRPDGVRVPGLVETRSLVPTLLEAAGAVPPERISAPSLLPWLLGRERDRPPTTIAAAESNGLFAVRDERWKLVVDARSGERRLFDLATDPGETRDLAAAEPLRRAEMERHLRAWRSGLAPLAGGGTTAIDAAQAEELRALGYLQ